MSAPLISRRKASNIFTGLFFVGLAILSFTNSWWPGILLALGLPLAVRQYLRGRLYDMCITLAIFGGLFIFYLFAYKTGEFLLPVLFLTGGLFILFRECTQPLQRTGIEEVEDAKQELIDDAEDDS